MNNRPRVYMRLSADSVKQLELVARVTNRPRNELFQDAVDRFIAEHNDGAPNLKRIAQSVEFIQVALDLMVRRDMPDERQPIMLAVAKRMEQFHGAR